MGISIQNGTYAQEIKILLIGHNLSVCTSAGVNSVHLINDGITTTSADAEGGVVTH